MGRAWIQVSTSAARPRSARARRLRMLARPSVFVESDSLVPMGLGQRHDMPAHRYLYIRVGTGSGIARHALGRANAARLPHRHRRDGFTRQSGGC